MDTSKDYYRILEVHPQASPEMIERAKRLLLQRYHPDKNPQRQEWASERTRLVLEAHRILSQPSSRRAYDAARRGTRSQPRSAPTSRPRPGSPAAGPRRASQGPASRPWAQTPSTVVAKAPPGYRTVVCAGCGRASHVRIRTPLYSVICGGCGRPLRHRLHIRAKAWLLRIDAALERLRARLVALLALAGIPDPRRDREKSSHGPQPPENNSQRASRRGSDAHPHEHDSRRPRRPV